MITQPFRAPLVKKLAGVLLLLLTSGAAVSAQVRAVETFRYADPKAAVAAWRALDGSPAVVAAPDGLTFPCPFDRERDRVYWDSAVSIDLSRATSFELDLTCDRPEALRSLAIYFKSGDGWYIWNKPLPRAGRQVLLIGREDFSTEGRPAGWNRIERLRVSPWRGAAAAAALTLHALHARTDTLLIVRATTSGRNAAEQNVSARTARRVSGWLRDQGVPHGMTTDTDVEAGALGGARVAVLPYNPYPSARMMKALRTFLERGGQLVVCYSAEPALAARMGFKLGAYRRTELPGRWSRFVFPEAAAWRVPERIVQESFNITPATPASENARVIAWWENAAGQRTGDPAWLASPQGFWMTHVLQNDDVANKADLLAGLLGSLDPSIWTAVARHRLATAGQIDSFRDIQGALSGIAAQAGQNEAVAALLDRARQENAALRALFAGGRFAQAALAGRTLRNTLTEAYARAQKPAPNEFRGVWDHDGIGWYPGDWDRTARELAGAGINAIFPNLLWGGLAHYPSQVLPVSFTARQLGDQAEQCLAAARKYGLQVHVWMVCWNLENAPADFVARMRKEGRLQVTVGGETIPWLDPADPRNVALAVAALREVVERYPVDGVHLDYVRYPDADVSFSAVSRREFEKARGRAVPRWPRDVAAGGALSAEYKRWRAGRITEFVRAVNREVKSVRPGVNVSAAVFSGYPDCIAGVGQDWGAWLKDGLVDFVCPMTYTTDAAGFHNRTRQHLALPGARGRVYPGLGVTAEESQLGPDQVIEQVLLTRQLGAAGFALFDLSHSLREEILPLLRLGLTRPAP